MVQYSPPTAVIRTQFFDEFLLGACGARCREVVPLAARLDTRVPVGVTAAVRLSETDLPVVLARGFGHSKMTASCPSSPVAADRSRCPAGGHAARHLSAPAGRAGGQRAREAAGR